MKRNAYKKEIESNQSSKKTGAITSLATICIIALAIRFGIGSFNNNQTNSNNSYLNATKVYETAIQYDQTDDGLLYCPTSILQQIDFETSKKESLVTNQEELTKRFNVEQEYVVYFGNEYYSINGNLTIIEYGSNKIYTHIVFNTSDELNSYLSKYNLSSQDVSITTINVKTLEELPNIYEDNNTLVLR